LIKKVIFDFDGTLADSHAVYRLVTNDVTDKFGLPRFTDEEYAHLSSIPIKDAIKELSVKWYDIPKYSFEGCVAFMKRISTVPLFDDISEMLNSLEDLNMRMSIISSNAADNIKHFLDINNLNCFDNVISCQRLFKKHRFIKQFIKSKNLQPDEVLYVGDEVRDIQACKKANIKVIAASWGFDKLENIQYEQPDFIADEPLEIVNIIKQLFI
jgi:phosphoglycolate phosphatase